MIISTIPLFIALPLGAAVAAWVFSRHPIAWFAGLFSVVTAGALLWLSVNQLGAQPISFCAGLSGPFQVSLRIDALTALMLVVINGIALCLLAFAITYMRHYTSPERFFTLFLFLIAGLNGVVLSADLFNLFVFMELASVAAYVLVGFGCEAEEIEASFKYFILGTIASLLGFFGIALLYIKTGVLDFDALSVCLQQLPHDGTTVLAIVLIFCSFALKAAVVPFHAWLPDAHPAAPAPVSAMLSGVVIKVMGVYVLSRFVFNVLGAPPVILSIMLVLGVLSMTVGMLPALVQRDIKRLLAYSSVGQIGFIIVGLALGTPLGIVGALFHLVNHSAMKSLLFLNAGSVEYSTGTRDITKLGGLFRATPVNGATALIGSLSIAGIPPFGGFWSKLIIIVACVQSGHYLVAGIAVLASILTLSAMLRFQRGVFFGAVQEIGRSVRRTPASMAFVLILLALACIGTAALMLGGFSTPLFIAPAAAVLQSAL